MALTKTICRHPLASKRFMIEFLHEEGGKTHEVFELLTRYEATSPIAIGSYGFVCAATDNELVEKYRLNPPEEYNDPSLSEEERADVYESYSMVAIKKHIKLFEQNRPRLWLCAARELQLMMAFKHVNVISALDFFIPLGECERMTYESIDYLQYNFDSVYIVMKKMDYTLREVLDSNVFTIVETSEESKEGSKIQFITSSNSSSNGSSSNSASRRSTTSTTTTITTTPIQSKSIGSHAGSNDNSVDGNKNHGSKKERIARCPRTHLTLHPLSCDYRKFILYQLLRGVGYMHLCHVIHRDIKPENIMLDRNYNTCVCDFGQSRDAVTVEASGIIETILDNCTQWYAAPETLTLAQGLLSAGYVVQKTLHAADVWSIGCIAAEMLIGRPFFYCRFRGGIGQLNTIMSVLGAPSAEDVENLLQHRDKDTQKVFAAVLRREMQPYLNNPSTLRALLQSPYNDVTEEEIKLIESLICYDPAKRITVQEALQSPYFTGDGYDPTIDPDETARSVQAVEPKDVRDAVSGRSFLWSLFLQRHPEVSELTHVLQTRSGSEGSKVESA